MMKVMKRSIFTFNNLVAARTLSIAFNFKHLVQRHFSTQSTPPLLLKPKEILVKEKGSYIEINYEGNKSHTLSAEFLRVNSPSAEVKGHGFKPKIVYGRRYVRIIGAEYVGNYAIRLIFDDLHETGIYSWAYLHELGENKFSLMRKYLSQLKSIGKSRDPRKNTANTAKASS
eukprot:TRINITY_DN756_c0_g1_i14.p1 TRINITY_DN756_c0_g1~~TRINITY_DN756_c0_g1_i14.p1  ORF type:complete len:172 (+),score=32.41 TRINITY_DN756_c0_g1_i14:16-531(+)